MSVSRSEILLYPQRTSFSPPPGMHAAVSLHGHSECSRESLDFIPRVARRIPLVAQCFERSLAGYRTEHGEALDFGEWYWRPPVTPSGLVESEREHLRQRLDLPALISITDHDTLEGPHALRASGRTDVPLSVEWSVPLGGSLFHLGVHCLPPKSADATMRALAAYTARGRTPGSYERLGHLLDALNECPETLVVLNHPYWDLAHAGQMQHESTLLAFLRAHHGRIHALELNGYRTWAENRRVLPLAKGFDLPVVGGGDRHGLAPNTIVNLTRARDLAEFAHELRVERCTRCVLFPEYAEPFNARVLQSAADVLRPHHQHHRGQITWAERVFIAVDGVERSVHSMWSREPLWLRGAIAITRAVGSRPFEALFELTRADGRETLEIDCRCEEAGDRMTPLNTDSASA